jgi:adenylate cyclase
MLARLLSAYLPMDRLQTLANGGVLPDRTSGAALFADLSGFTQLTNSLARELGPQRGAEELTRHLNAIYTALIEEVHHYRGTVIAFSGDAITCWFDGDVGARATACALHMQQAMGQFAAVHTPGGSVISLAMKVAVAAGPTRRFQVGDPTIQLMDTLAGATLERLLAAEHLANKGEVVVSSEVAAALGPILEVQEWRTDEHGLRFATVRAFRARIPPQPWPDVPFALLEHAQLQPWLLPPVHARLEAGQDVFLAELRHAVVLFVSFSGLDFDGDDAAGNKLDAYLRWAQGVVARYEGALLQLTIGDKGAYFYCSFGAPLAHEDDAARALQAALLLCQPPATLDYIREVKIGVSQGRLRTGAYGGVTRRTYGVLGDEVNVAARLMQAAPPGQIYVRDLVHGAATNRFIWEALPPLQVKGRSDTLAAYRLLSLGERTIHHLQSAIYGLPMVGRNAELTLIGQLIAQTLNGQGQVVALMAEAGMGKSRLLAECVRLARDNGLRIYSGECQSYGTNDSYLVWENIWQSFFGLDAAMPLVDQIARLEAQLSAFDPSLLPRLPLLGAVLGLLIPDNDLTSSLDVQTRKRSLEALLVRCVRARAQYQPLMLVLDDAQWMDPLSYDLLEAIVQGIVDDQVLVIGALRPPDAAHLVAARIDELPHVTTLNLRELSPREVAELVILKQVHLGSEYELADEVVRQIVERTQGNPFYVEELLNYLHSQGIVPTSAQEFDQLDLPTSLSSLILSRIDQLSESQKTTLKVASVIGRLFRAGWLVGIYPELGDYDRIQADLETLSRLDLTAQDAPEAELTYLFKHILTHGVAYESLPYETRAWLHGKLGAYIEQHYAENQLFVDLLAFHYDRSPNEAKRREYLQRAGEAAQASYANAVAIDYFTRLLPLLPVAEQLPILLRMAKVYELVGKWNEVAMLCQQVLALAERLGDRGALAQAQLAMGNYFSRKGEYVAAAEWLDKAQEGFAALGDSTGRGQVLHAQGNLAYRQGEFMVATAHWQASLELRRVGGDLSGVATLLNNLGAGAQSQGDYTSAERYYAQSLELARQLNDRLTAARALNNWGMIDRDQANFAAARTRLNESLSLRREVGDRWGVANGLQNLGQIAHEEGEYATAHALFEESLLINRELGDLGAIAHLLEDFAYLAAAQDLLPRALQLLGAATSLRKSTGALRGAAEQQRFEQRRTTIESALGPDSAELNWEVGRAMSLTTALTLASEK